MNKLKEFIYECNCNRCKAVVKLVEDSGAILQFVPSRAGRLCELAVVAAEGEEGMEKSKVVSERRKYAEHLDVELSGGTSNSNDPVHIEWAINNSNHNPNAKNRINLGTAKASFANGKYRLL